MMKEKNLRKAVMELNAKIRSDLREEIRERYVRVHGETTAIPYIFDGEHDERYED